MGIQTLAIVFALAVCTIIFIVLKKSAHLRRLTPEVLDSSDIHKGFFSEFFPELATLVNSSIIRSLRDRLLSVSANMAKATQRLWHSLGVFITKAVQTLQYKHKSAKANSRVVSRKDTSALISDKIARGSKSFVEKEQELIISIAKDPKSILGYENLADLYIEYGIEEDARSALQRVLELDSANTNARVKLDKLLKNSNI